VRNVVLRTEVVEEAPSFDAQTRLERIARIVKSRMDDAAVMRARLQAGAPVAFEHANGTASLRNRQGGGEAGYAGTDYRDVDSLHA
jgi:hypothetical protein